MKRLNITKKFTYKKLRLPVLIKICQAGANAQLKES